MQAVLLWETEKVPAEQFMHILSLAMLHGITPNFPAVQDWQVLHVLCAAASWKKENWLGHAVQLSELLEAEKEPGAHGAHSASPREVQVVLEN